jgi:hypothetical protein
MLHQNIGNYLPINNGVIWCYFRRLKFSHSFFTNLFVVISFLVYLELKMDKCGINRSFI